MQKGWDQHEPQAVSVTQPTNEIPRCLNALVSLLLGPRGLGGLGGTCRHTTPSPAHKYLELLICYLLPLALAPFSVLTSLRQGRDDTIWQCRRPARESSQSAALGSGAALRCPALVGGALQLARLSGGSAPRSVVLVQGSPVRRLQRPRPLWAGFAPP